ncbi:MAG TPA: hypothetical protein VM033_01530 [Gemmatimonadaceae bacterium]|nr:hypothetical protein [Gemmatimonadaceae bacterium]
MMPSIRASTLVAALSLALPVSPLAAQREQVKADERPKSARAGDSLTIVLPGALAARSIGPAVMGGRVSAIALDARTPGTVYVGLGTGGIMKTQDNGITWSAIFEHEAVASIGDIAIAPSDSSVVWVATGEGNDRNSVSWGNGVYRSTDGGGTWTRAGLAATKAIARIVVAPNDPRTAYAAAIGDLWTHNADRGLYKTTDAGVTWKKILAVPAPNDTRTGAGDVAIDPANPNIVYATMYARRRRPYEFTYGARATGGADVGGIYRSTDAGATWQKLTDGLPTLTGRIGLSIHAKNTKIVYAIVQSDEGGLQDIGDPHSKKGGVFRSDDGGSHWTRMSPLNPRPFYFSQIRVDPTDDQKVYLLGYALHVSEDGGRTWREDRFKNVHPDNHALVVDPANPRHLLLGTDGGVYQSYSAAGDWEHLARFAAGEFYRVNVDAANPTRICGGLQDNTNWVGTLANRTGEGIRNADWVTIGGGDGSYCVFDAADPNLVYSESQQGYLVRFNLASGQDKQLRPEPTEGQPAFRFHWMSPLLASVHDKGAMYYGGNVLFRLTNHGENWTVISPDLSTKELEKMSATGSGAEVYGVIYALAESPVKRGVLWAGTDDGKLWRTDDEGAHWTDLSANLPAAGRGHWISRIEAGHADAGVAYVAVDAHRDGIYAPLLYRTADGGRTWASIAAGIPNDAPVKVIREDPRNPDVLYAGTEFGLLLSIDRGRSWAKFGKLPTVAVDDILITPAHDLVVATHGRSLYVVDDVRPIAEARRDVLAGAGQLFPIRTVEAYAPIAGFKQWAGSSEFRGENPPAGALLTYFLKELGDSPVKFSVATESGRPVANLTGSPAPGINRVVWDLKPTKDVLTEYGGEGQKFVRAGKYVVTMTAGKVKSTQTVVVTTAPGLETR